MNFDRKSLSKLINMSDAELEAMLVEIGNEAGVDMKKIKIGKGDLAKIRTFLTFASDDDISKILGQLRGKENG